MAIIVAMLTAKSMMINVLSIITVFDTATLASNTEKYNNEL
jgi:hypothetical protein